MARADTESGADLEADELLVLEDTPVVLELHALSRAAHLARRWLLGPHHSTSAPDIAYRARQPTKRGPGCGRS
eukprot:1148582-Rhodomonas_salina.3